MIAKLNIGQRLAAGFVLILSLTMLTTGIALWRLHDSAQETQAMMNTPLRKERMASDWYANTSASIRRTSAIAKSSDASLVPFFAADKVATSKSSSALQDGIEALLGKSEEKALFSDIVSVRKRFADVRDKLIELRKEGRAQEANELLDKEFVPIGKSYLSAVQTFEAWQRKEIDARVAEISALNNTSSFVLSSLGGLMLVLGGLCAWSPAATQTAPPLATQTAPPGRGELTH